jgi:nicotinate-nucleotide adenylyltransferase
MTAETRRPPVEQTGPERIGLLGGTFDPVHFGHLRIAQEALERFDLERVEFIPSNIPPHKPSRATTGTAHRLAMLRLALQGNPRFILSQAETHREGVSYLVDTLSTMRGNRPGNTALYFLMGMDSFLEISTWHRYPELFSFSNFVVLSRPGYPRPNLREVVSGEVADRFVESAGEPPALEHDSGNRILFQETTALAISASDIRRGIRAGRSIRYLLPDPVREYILQNRLYFETGDTQK